MEQDPSKSKIQEVSTQELIESEQLKALETQEDIDVLTASLRFFLESLEKEKSNLENPKELLNTDQRNEIREKIAKTQKTIKEIHGRIHTLVLDKIDTGENIETFKELERENNQTLLEIINEESLREEDVGDFEKIDSIDTFDFSKDKLN